MGLMPRPKALLIFGARICITITLISGLVDETRTVDHDASPRAFSMGSDALADAQTILSNTAESVKFREATFAGYIQWQYRLDFSSLATLGKPRLSSPPALHNMLY